MFKRIALYLSLSIFICSICSIGFCFDENEVCGLKEVGLLAGWAEGDLKDEQPDYEMVLTAARFGWNIKPWMRFIRFPEKSLCEFVLEPYINTITSPDSNAELGTAFFFKYGHPLFNGNLVPYIEFGSSMQWMSQHINEQSTQFNFASAGGAGFYFFLRDDLALSLGYRFRHMSNCGIDDPNSGVNTQHYLAGISWMH